MNVDRVSILLLDGQVDELFRASPRADGRRERRQACAPVDRPESGRERVAYLSDNAAADDASRGKSILTRVCAARCARRSWLRPEGPGILYVDNLTATHSFADEDLEFLIAFGGLTAIAIETRNWSERIRREALVRSNSSGTSRPNIAQVIAQQQDAGRLPSEKRPVVSLLRYSRLQPDVRTMTGRIAKLLTKYFTEWWTRSSSTVALSTSHGRRDHGAVGAPIAHEDDADRAVQCALGQLTELE